MTTTLRHSTVGVLVALIVSAVAVAPTVASAKPGAPGFICEVLQRALKGTKIALHATKVEHKGGVSGGGNIANHRCAYQNEAPSIKNGEAPFWSAYLFLENNELRAREITKLHCEGLESQKESIQYHPAQTGAAVSCAAVQPSPLPGEFKYGYFSKGAWLGSLVLHTGPHNLSFSLMQSILKKINAQLATF